MSVQNRGIALLHNVFKEARASFTQFYQDFDFTKIRFTFGEVDGEGEVFRVKFSTTHKSVKFLVDPTGTQAQYQQLEKTSNIVEDIATIHHVVHQGLLILTDRDIKDRLFSLFTWGMWDEKDRSNDVYRVDAVAYSDNIARDKQHLYYGLIQLVQVIGKQPDDRIKLVLHFYKGGRYTLMVESAMVPHIRTGRIILINYWDQWNVLTFNSAKHHVNFAPSDFNLCVEYLNTVRT